MRRLVILLALTFALMPAVAASDGASGGAASSNEIGSRAVADGGSWSSAIAASSASADPRSIAESGTQESIAADRAVPSGYALRSAANGRNSDGSGTVTAADENARNSIGAADCDLRLGSTAEGAHGLDRDNGAVSATPENRDLSSAADTVRMFCVDVGKSFAATGDVSPGLAADSALTFSGEAAAPGGSYGLHSAAADAQVLSGDSGAVIALTGENGRRQSAADDSAQTIASGTDARSVSGENSAPHSASDGNAPESAINSGTADASSDDPGLYSADDFDLGSVTDSLPDEVLENLPADIFDPSTASETGVGFFASVVSKLVRAALGPALKTFSKLLGIVVAASVISSVRSTVKSGLSGVFDFISGLCLMLMLYGVVEGMFTLVKSYLFTLTGVMDSFIPVMSAMAAAGGDLNSAVVSSGGLILGLDLIEKLAANGLMPVLQLCFGIAMASGVGSLKLSGISKLIRDGFSWTLGLSAAAISAVMSFQTTIAARADSLSMRAVRFAASNAIPVAGGIAADAVRTVAGSLSLVKSTVGWAGVVIIALMTLPVMIQVLLTRIGVLLAGTSASVLGLEREKSLLDEVSGLLGSLIAVCLVASLMFVYALAVFARGAVALAG